MALKVQYQQVAVVGHRVQAVVIPVVAVLIPAAHRAEALVVLVVVALAVEAAPDLGKLFAI